MKYICCFYCNWIFFLKKPVLKYLKFSLKKYLKFTENEFNNVKSNAVIYGIVIQFDCL